MFVFRAYSRSGISDGVRFRNAGSLPGIGGRRSFQVGGQDWNSGVVHPVGSRRKGPGGGLGGETPEADHTFVKIFYFEPALKLYESVQYEMIIFIHRYSR